MLLAELFSQTLGCVTFVNYNPLHATLSDVDINVELGVPLIESVLEVVELLVNKVLGIFFNWLVVVVNLRSDW
jgi:hypothetical protein